MLAVATFEMVVMVVVNGLGVADVSVLRVARRGI